MPPKDYYKILGLDKGASEKDIKSAYRRLARKHHPDVNPDNKASEERFKDISEAYEVLRDPEKRSAYDRFGDQWQQWQRAQEAGAGGPYGDADGTDFSFDYTGGTGDFSSIFEQIFGGLGGQAGGRGGSRSARVDLGGFGAPPPPDDMEAYVELSLEEAYAGGQRQVNANGRMLNVKIPAGVDTGSRIRIPGDKRGNGSVYLRVKVKPHQKFRREKDNLEVDVAVPYTTAALGGEVYVPTMTGRVKMKVPPGVQSGQTLRLQGKGMPRLKGSSHGDLIAKIMVGVPKTLSDRQRELLEELRQIDEGAKLS